MQRAPTAQSDTEIEDWIGDACLAARLTRVIAGATAYLNTESGNRLPHAHKVHQNLRKLVDNREHILDLNAYDRFLLSATVFCHDVGCAMGPGHYTRAGHGEASADSITQEPSQFALRLPEARALAPVVATHDKKGRELADGLDSLGEQVDVEGHNLDPRRMAVLLALADTLQIEGRTMPTTRVRDAVRTTFEQARYSVDLGANEAGHQEAQTAEIDYATDQFRSCITGWGVQAQEIVLSVTLRPEDDESALLRSFDYVLENEFGPLVPLLKRYELPEELSLMYQSQLSTTQIQATLSVEERPLWEALDVRGHQEPAELYMAGCQIVRYHCLQGKGCLLDIIIQTVEDIVQDVTKHTSATGEADDPTLQGLVGEYETRSAQLHDAVAHEEVVHKLRREWQAWSEAATRVLRHASPGRAIPRKIDAGE